MLDIQMPPASWITAPPPPTAELQLPLDTLGFVCGALGVQAARSQIIYGCMIWRDGRCLLILPKIQTEITKADQRQVRRHEMAHCNGWRHEDH